MTQSTKKTSNKATLEYENLDLPPVYVDGAQGTLSPNKDVLHVSFSERIAGLPSLSVNTEIIESQDNKTCQANFGDCFGLDTGNIHLIRRVEANLIFSRHSLEGIISWLQQQLNTLPK